VNIKKVGTIIFLILSMFVISNVCSASTLVGEVHIKSIIPVSYIPMEGMVFMNFTIPNGTLYQSGIFPDIFRNQLVILDEDANEGDHLYYILDTPILNMRIAQLLKVRSTLYVERFTFRDASYYQRWAFFLMGYTKPPHYPPNELFDIENIPWNNFGEGWYYINQTYKTVVIWTIPDIDSNTLQNIGEIIINIANTTFPYHELIYLENNYYFTNNLDFCENCIRNVSSKSYDDLTFYIEDINDRISECMDRRTQYNTDLGYLAFSVDPFFFENNFFAFNFINPMIDDLTENVKETIEQNYQNLENLEQTKSIIQSELNKRLQESEIQRDYMLTAVSVLLSLLVGGFITIFVNLHLQKNERNASNARQQRIEIYEPLFDEINEINKKLDVYICPFNARETSKIWCNLSSGIKLRVPTVLENLMVRFNGLGREYYNLYCESLEILENKMDQVMYNYVLDGTERGIIDRVSIEKRHQFDILKRYFFDEYQGDFFAGELFDIPFRRTFENMLSKLKYRYSKEHVFNRILTKLDNEQKIIDLRNSQRRLKNCSTEIEEFLEGKIKNILEKYEKKLKEM